MANQMIFVNLPVQSVSRSIEFFQQLGYAHNPQFTNEQAAAIVISEHIYAMLLEPAFFQTFTKKAVADASKVTEAIVCLSAESRAAVDSLVGKALKAGAKETRPADDHGFMYGRSFEDLDGHQWEVMWMDPAHVQQQPSK